MLSHQMAMDPKKLNREAIMNKDDPPAVGRFLHAQGDPNSKAFGESKLVQRLQPRGSPAAAATPAPARTAPPAEETDVAALAAEETEQVGALAAGGQPAKEVAAEEVTEVAAEGATKAVTVEEGGKGLAVT